MIQTGTDKNIVTELSDDAQSAVLGLNTLFKKAHGEMKQGDVPYIFSAYDNTDLISCRQFFLQISREADFTSAFTSSGIPQHSSFSGEALRLIKSRILPYVRSNRDAVAIIQQIFNDPNGRRNLHKLFEACPDFTENLTGGEKDEILSIFNIQLVNALKIISYRIAALGMDDEVYTRAGKDDELITPFMEQNREVNELLANIEAGNADKIAEDLGQVKVMIKHCLESIALIDKAAEKNGTSLHQTFLLRKLELLIERMTRLLQIICADDRNMAVKELSKLIRDIILMETASKKLTDFVSGNINLIAYRITENKRKTGEHYIANDKGEYWDLFISACGGGLIVSFMVIIKTFAHHLGLPPLWETFSYCLIYALGFVVIHVLNFTLATKQPAMTAAYIAASLDDIKEDASRYKHLAATIATVMRSQIISFAGNLLIAFPLSLLWIYLLGLAMHHSPLQPHEAEHMLNDIHPLHSLSFLYASWTGVLLFVAGIVSGFGDNKVMVSRIGLRLENHPTLKKWFSAARLHKWAMYTEKNMGPLLGNIAFGFMLGITIFIGKITGLPFDIRHITFSTGNAALGYYGFGFHIGMQEALWTFAGLFVIGTLNFVVSFALALQVAVRSRGMRLKDYPDVMKAVLKYLVQHPLHFIFPPLKNPEIQPEELQPDGVVVKE